MGPLTLEARIEALDRVLDIQQRAGVDLINAEECARIRELIEARTFPDKWEGDEPRADLWLDSVYGDGSVQPILFRDLVA
jgi:DNA sulfur modification protein DndC